MNRTELTQAAHRALREDPDIRAVVLYGSRARGTARDDSDWDVALFVGTRTEDRARALKDAGVHTAQIELGELDEPAGCGSLLSAVLEEGQLLCGETVVMEVRTGKQVSIDDFITWMESARWSIQKVVTELERPPHSRFESEHRDSEKDLTRESAAAAEHTARCACALHGVQVPGGHDVKAIARVLREQQKGAGRIADHIEEMDGTTREAHGLPYAGQAQQRERVQARTMKAISLFVEIVKGVGVGEGAIAGARDYLKGANREEAVGALVSETGGRWQEMCERWQGRKADAQVRAQLERASRECIQLGERLRSIRETRTV